MNKIEVGKRYPGEVRSEGIVLDYNKGFALYVFLPRITSAEAKGFQKGRYKFALTEVDGILFFLLEFKGAITMSDAPFHFGLYRDARIEDLPVAMDETEGLGLNIIAVDSSTSIVKSIRMIGLSHDFSKKLIEICWRQNEEKVSFSRYMLQLAQIQNRYTAEDLYRKSFIRCGGK